MGDHRKELEIVFRQIFDNDALVLRPEMTASDIEGWDSSQQVALLSAIEGRFKIRFTTREIARLMIEGANVGTMLEILEAKLADRSSAGALRAAIRG
jgi:acyl carrier protein